MLEITHVFAAVWQNLGAVSMLLVVLPFSLVFAASDEAGLPAKMAGDGRVGLLPAHGKPVEVPAVSVAAVIEPLADVGLAIGVDEPTVACGLTLHPLALVHGPVGPYLDAPSVLLAPFPLADIHLIHVAHDGRTLLDALPVCHDQLVVVLAEVPVCGLQ